MRPSYNKIFPLIIILFFCFTACQNKGDKKTTEQSDTKSPPSKSFKKEVDLQQAFKVEGLQSWVKEMKEEYPHFSTTHFNSSEKKPISISSKKYSKEDWQTFQSSFIPSPNKKWAIDLKSYNHWLNDSSQEMESGSPDNAVNLVQLSPQTKTQLLFTGPGTTFQKAVWLNDSVVIITGESDANLQNKMQPIYWKVNTQSERITTYHYLPRDSL